MTGDDRDVGLWHLHLTAQLVLRLGNDTLAARVRDLDEAIAMLTDAGAHYRWCRWRLMLATERQRRRNAMAERARALVGPLTREVDSPAARVGWADRA